LAPLKALQHASDRREVHGYWYRERRRKVRCRRLTKKICVARSGRKTDTDE